ncbi:unnamed protein product, partial [marine sediment metagenome]
STSVIALFDLQDRLADLKSEARKLGDKKAVKGEIVRIDSLISGLRAKAGFSETENAKYQELDKNKTVLEKERGRGLLLKDGIHSLKVFLLQQLPRDFALAYDVEVDAQKTKFEDDEEALKVFEDLRKKVKQALVDHINQIVSEHFTILGDLKRNLETLETQIKDAIGELDPYLRKIENQNLLKSLKSDLDQERTLLAAIEETENSIKVLEEKIKSSRKGLLGSYGEIFKRYVDIKAELSKPEYKSISEDLELQVRLSFDSNRFAEQFETLL